MMQRWDASGTAAAAGATYARIGGRHGEDPVGPAWSRRRYQARTIRGRQALSLTERGRAEAAAVAQRIASAWQPSIVYTSPLERCIATGHAIAQDCNVPAAIATISTISIMAPGNSELTRKCNQKLLSSSRLGSQPRIWCVFPRGVASGHRCAQCRRVRLVLARHPETQWCS